MTTAFAKVGFSGDYGGTYFLTRLVGTAKARELYYLSDRIEMKEAERLGPRQPRRPRTPTSMRETLRARASASPQGPRVAYRYMKENLNRAAGGARARRLPRPGGHPPHPHRPHRRPPRGREGVRREARAEVCGEVDVYTQPILGSFTPFARRGCVSRADLLANADVGRACEGATIGLSVGRRHFARYRSGRRLIVLAAAVTLEHPSVSCRQSGD